MVSRRTFWEICYTLFYTFFGTPTKVCLSTGNGVAGGPLFGKLVYTFLHFLGHFFLHFFGTPTKVCLRTGNGVAGGAPHTTAMPTLPVPHWPRCPYFFPLHFVIFPFLSFGNISIYFAICCFWDKYFVIYLSCINRTPHISEMIACTYYVKPWLLPIV